ncbi:MAG: serine hydrolase [Phenylobacterium sp.]|uniref:serine hydrolase domain-containing protein n=1 Tax=Phenylobacterium sp. TaxID=1871053 RepID=UPI0025D1EA4E|nr:serine hydrolase domain-containing protein [Phenylobacterium sp.]MBI1197480.1 serine hydrolase [Phenylobacterium sp.]
MDGAQAPAGFNTDALAGIAPALKGLVDQGALSGVVTLIWRKGEIVQVNAIGQRDIEGGLPMERDTLFRIASMTKPVTTVAAMQLVEEGKLKLSDPVTKWIPELAGMLVLEDAAGGLDKTRPAQREITVEDLMTHRAGLAYGFTSVGPIAHAHEAKLGSPLVNPLSPDEWLKALGELPLSYEPGERFHYSHATDVLGFLVARIEGKPLGEVLKARVFDPLGLKDTFFWVPPEKRGRLAKLYQAPADGGPLKDVSLPLTDTPPAFEGGGGGLISTADDYLKFARMLMGRGEVDGVRLLKAETVDEMAKNRLTEVQRSHTFMGMPFWLSQGFGLGLSMVMDSQKHEWMGAGGEGAFGWPGAFGTWWQADPKNDLILIYLIQDSMPLGPEAVTAMQGQRPTGRIGCPMFQKLTYAALS